MNVKQKSNGMYAKTKYSQIDQMYITPTARGDWATAWILKYGYAVMNSFAINEVMNVIRALRELGVEYSMKTIEGAQNVSNDKKWKEMYYEFTTVYFEDDRK